jgi:serine/threonine protein kinase
VSLNDDTDTTSGPPHGGDTPGSAQSFGSPEPGAARSHVHSVRPIGSIVAERYIVREHIGRGRLDERYAAVDRSLSDPNVASERSVVLHFLNARGAAQTRLLQKLETSYHHPHSWAHRNIVSVIGFGSDRGEYFFVTEEIEGGTLRTILDEVAPEVPPEDESFSVIAAIGDALKYAHAKGVIHGDIRPENVFVTRDLVVKVLDLLPATLPRTVPMFPEDKAQSGASVPDPRDDVYGLACVAYELFAGRHPFNSNTALEAFASGLKPAPILSLDPRSWSALVGGLALRRDDRTPSVAAFLADLGVTGRERLRRAAEADRAAAPNPTPAAPAYDDDWSDLSDRTVAPVRARAPSARAPSVSAPIPDQEYEPFRIRFVEQPKTSKSWLPWVAALAIGGGAVYWNYEWLHARAPDWLATGLGVVENVTHRDATATSVPTAPPAQADAARPSASPPVANPAPANPAPQPSANVASAGPAAAPKEASPAPKESTSPPKKEPSPSSTDSTAQAKETSPLPNAAIAPAPAVASSNPAPPTQVKQPAVAGEPVAPEIFEPEKSVVVISEAAPSAAVTIHRRGGLDAPSSFIWWTTDGTAVADEDYINLGARIERLAAGEQTRTIYIPIVHDSKPEGRESFYVSVRSAQGKREDPAQRVEVVIEDDD